MTPDFIAKIETHFAVTMAAEYGASLPLFFSNAPVPKTMESFAVIHVVSSDIVLPINLGIHAKNRNVGLIQIDVYTPKDTGAGDGRRIAAFAGKQFQRRNMIVQGEGNIVLKEVVLRDRGEVRGRHKQQADINYEYDFRGV